MKTKSFLYSKTFWIAIIQGVMGALFVFQTEYPEVGWIILVKSVLDVILRSVTKTKLSV